MTTKHPARPESKRNKTMQINLPKIGNNFGTCSWLKAGLEEGTISLHVGTAKNHKADSAPRNGLWLKIRKPLINTGNAADDFNRDGSPREWSQTLAIFNLYELTPSDFQNAYTYTVITEQTGEIEDTLGVTPACWSRLREIAEKWAEDAMALRENDSCSEIVQ